MEKSRMTKYVEQAAAGDAKAMEALYKFTYPGAYSLTSHLCANPNDVEDILQESYITAFSRLDTIRDKAAFPAWLKKIVVNTWRAFAKEKSNAYETAVYDVTDEYFEEGMYSESALDAVEISENNREIYRLVNELPENQRVCVILFYYEDMKVDEIAETLNIPIGSVKSRLYYGRQQLRSMMEQQGMDSYASALPRKVPVVADAALFARIIAVLKAGSGATAVGGAAIKVGAAIASVVLAGGVIGGAFAMRSASGEGTKPTAAVTMTTATTATTVPATTPTTTATTTATTTVATTTTTISTQPRIYMTFDYEEDGDGIVLTRYTGNESDVTIPETIDGKTVTAVGEGAFSRSNVLRSVVIPSTVRRIGGSAFRECRNLRSVTLGSGAEEIGGSAFLGCVALERLEIPSNVRSVGGFAFAHCARLAEVRVAEGVQVIGYAAFRDCASLQTAVLPASVTSIGDDTFDGTPEGFYISADQGTYAYEYALNKGYVNA